MLDIELDNMQMKLIKKKQQIKSDCIFCSYTCCALKRSRNENDFFFRNKITLKPRFLSLKK